MEILVIEKRVTHGSGHAATHFFNAERIAEAGPARFAPGRPAGDHRPKTWIDRRDLSLDQLITVTAS